MQYCKLLIFSTLIKILQFYEKRWKYTFKKKETMHLKCSISKGQKVYLSFFRKSKLKYCRDLWRLISLFMCVFGVSIAVYLPATESIVYKYFISIAQSRNMKYWKLTHNCNIAKQEGDKIQTEKFFWILFMSVFTGKSIKNKRFAPFTVPTNKHRDDVSGGNCEWCHFLYLQVIVRNLSYHIFPST